MNNPTDYEILMRIVKEQLDELQAARDYVESAAEQVEWCHIELAAAKADNEDLERENRRMRWALSKRWSSRDGGTYCGATMLDDYKELSEEFWERHGL